MTTVDERCATCGHGPQWHQTIDRRGLMSERCRLCGDDCRCQEYVARNRVDHVETKRTGAPRSAPAAGPWIAVTKREPARDTVVLIANIDLGWFRVGPWDGEWFEDGRNVTRITHWAEIVPPKETP